MKLFYSVLVFILLATGCSAERSDVAGQAEQSPGAYYWKTVFSLDSASREIVGRHGIGRIYLRMFDVTVNPAGAGLSTTVIPDATVRIKEDAVSATGAEFVPVVYITLDAIRKAADNEEQLAENIVERVKNMCSYNELPGVSELQLDCDWTTGTERSFFSLCNYVRKAIADRDLNWKLSSTIRLHQLARPVPPVDRGVLMVYNTGSFDDLNAVNSILDPADVAQYIDRLNGYNLPLDVAYPTFSWQLLFRDGRFAGLLRGIDLTSTDDFSRMTENKYMAKHDIISNNRIIRAGDIIRAEDSPVADILAVKEQTEERLKGRPHSNIIYHLDYDNLSKYTPDEIDRILSTAR